MSCLCKEIERLYGSSRCKCTRYRDQFPDCECEASSVSDHSPGTLNNDERLIRTVYSPHQIDRKTDEIKPAAFSDARTRGFSVNRKDHISEADLQAKIEEKVARDKAGGRNKDGFWKVAFAACGDVRQVVAQDGKRLFCVYDTATEDDTSHADVCQAVEPPPNTPGRDQLSKKIRLRLVEAFGRKATDLRTAYLPAG